MGKLAIVSDRWLIRFVLGAMFLGYLVLLIGCGGTQSASSESSSPTEAVADVSTPPHPAASTVHDFMTAMLRGEDEAIRSLLTPTARQKGEEKGIPFAPPASDTATFRVDRTTPQGENGAYVHTTLTDLDEMGRPESAEIIWIVALGSEGWRVAGAAVALFEGQEPTVINFEDPDAAQEAIAAAEAREAQRSASRDPQPLY